VSSEQSYLGDKIYFRAHRVRQLNRIGKNILNILYTGGTFDLFHSGHINFLKKCKQISGELGKVIVSLNTDSFIDSFKGKPPVCSESERLAVVESCVYVDEVILNFGGANSKPAIERVKPNLIAVGSDWARKNVQAGTFSYEGLAAYDNSLGLAVSKDVDDKFKKLTEAKAGTNNPNQAIFNQADQILNRTIPR
jgi:cytidyltransferase-like protein